MHRATHSLTHERARVSYVSERGVGGRRGGGIKTHREKSDLFWIRARLADSEIYRSSPPILSASFLFHPPTHPPSRHTSWSSISRPAAPFFLLISFARKRKTDARGVLCSLSLSLSRDLESFRRPLNVARAPRENIHSSRLSAVLSDRTREYMYTYTCTPIRIR